MESYAELQIAINGIDSEFANVAKRVSESTFAKSGEGVEEISHEIFQTATIRPKAVLNLAKFVQELVKYASASNALNELNSAILNQFVIYTQETENVGQMYSTAKFLRNVYTLQVISLSDVQNTIEKVKVPRYTTVLYDTFVPEFGSSKVERSAWPMTLLTESWTQEQIDEFNNYLNNDGEEDSILAAIRKDDTTPMGGRFNFKKALFTEEINSTLPIVDIAAFYGSNKCFDRIVPCIPRLPEDLARYAVMGGNLEIVKFCQENGVNCAKQIELAIQYHRVEVYDYLATINQEHETPLIGVELSANFMHLLNKKTNSTEVVTLHFGQAVAAGHYAAASFAAERSKDIFTKHETLTAAVINGMPNIVAAFLEADPKYARRFPNGNSDLYTAAINGRYNVVERLLDFPVDINQCTPAHVLAKEGKLELLKKFFSVEGFQPELKDQDGVTLLNCAIISGKMDVIEYVFEKCPNINNKDNLGHTPFHKAISLSNLEVADYFLKKGADVNIPDSTGRTPLHTAAGLGDYEVTKYILAIPGIDINARTQHKRTPLHDAIKKGNIDIIKAIAEYPGVDPNICDDTDRTPLHEAVLGGRLPSAETIGKIPSVDMNKKCKGKTAFKLARTKEMRQLVLELGGHK